jgi:glycerol uptake facilitator-like aquaporin
MMLSQFAGAILGQCLAWMSLYNRGGMNVTRAGVPESELVLLQPAEGHSVYNTFKIEVICTFIFVMVCLIMKTEKTKPTA